MAPWLDEYVKKEVAHRIDQMVKERMADEMPLIYTAMKQLNQIANRDWKEIGKIAASSDDVKQMVLNEITEAAQSGRIFLYSNDHVIKARIRALDAQIAELNARIEELHMNFVLKSDAVQQLSKF